jgi:hypothetical protein
VCHFGVFVCHFGVFVCHFDAFVCNMVLFEWERNSIILLFVLRRHCVRGKMLVGGLFGGVLNEMNE